MENNNTRIVQQHVKVKQVARQANLMLELPISVIEDYEIKKDMYAAVSVSKKPKKLLVIYEFSME